MFKVNKGDGRCLFGWHPGAMDNGKPNHLKLGKLVGRLEGLVASLDDRNDLKIHQNIDQFYYMQKSEELKVLMARHKETQEALRIIGSRLERFYFEIYCRWRKDVRWLGTHLRKRNL